MHLLFPEQEDTKEGDTCFCRPLDTKESIVFVRNPLPRSLLRNDLHVHVDQWLSWVREWDLFLTFNRLSWQYLSFEHESKMTTHLLPPSLLLPLFLPLLVLVIHSVQFICYSVDSFIRASSEWNELTLLLSCLLCPASSSLSLLLLSCSKIYVNKVTLLL